MARQSFTIANRFFPTKTALEKEAKRIRAAQPLNRPLDPEDQAFIADLFAQLYPKPDFARKGMGVGITAIQVIQILGDRCFRLTLADGRTVEPSLRVCFNHALTRAKPTVYSTLRFEVFDQCRTYRDAYFRQHADPMGRAPCELTGRLITAERGECEIDHIPPNTFRSIVDAFLTEQGLTPDDIQTVDAPDGFGDVLADRRLASDWRAFHKARASFRVLARTEHVRITQQAAQAPA